MTYNEFRKMVSGWPLIYTRDVASPGKAGQAMRNQLERWRKSGLIMRLRKGLYMLGEADRRFETPRPFIANQLYGPSYVSLEYALAYYGLIPEMVRDLTSVTSRKTYRIRNEFGTFIYRHIGPAVFRGFQSVKGQDGIPFLIAEPEKALVDLLYLDLGDLKPGDTGVFEDSYRLRDISSLDPDKIVFYARLFNNKKLEALALSITRRFFKIKKEGR